MCQELEKRGEGAFRGDPLPGALVRRKAAIEDLKVSDVRNNSRALLEHVVQPCT